ncbi:hypothetical protein [Nonomuraea sp. NPDC050643]|uniref:hypothetical protein n=1 Tax=Nonomuraea sp. NPDC050643 TaxID=3155660 RepID=UPI0033F44FB3
MHRFRGWLFVLVALMVGAVVAGCEIIATCEAPTSWIFDPARRAMNRCAATGST